MNRTKTHTSDLNCNGNFVLQMSKNIDVNDISAELLEHFNDDEESLIFDSSYREGDFEFGNTDNINAMDKIPIIADPNFIKPKRNKFQWVVHSKWDSLDKVEDFLQSNGFVLYDNKDLLSGQKFYFRCESIPKDRKRADWCAQQFIVFLPADSPIDILLQWNGNDHNHNALLLGKRRPISKEMLAFINDLYDKGTTIANSIRSHIDSARKEYNLFQDEPTPLPRQLEYVYKLYRNRDTRKMINLGGLMSWCEQRSVYSNNIDEAYVLSHECNTNKIPGFRFAMGTQRLLGILSTAEIICIDATYKLNWNGYPLIILGTVDRTKRFHPMIYACSSHETGDDYAYVFRAVKNSIAKYVPSSSYGPRILIADGANPIRNGFYTEHKATAELDVMCFAHVIRNLRKRPYASKNNKALILDDVRKMQLAPNRNIFAMMTNLFIKKWQIIEPNFVAYFKKEWLGVHVNWFEGAADYTPSTNNALESHNAVIKRKITFRRKLPLQEFLNAMLTMTNDVSKQFADDTRKIAMEPNIPRDMMMRAAELHNDGFTVFRAHKKQTGATVYIFPSEKCSSEHANLTYYQSLTKRQWTSFDEFIDHGFQMFWLVSLSSLTWKSSSTCTCPVFFKQHICKHIVALALKEKLLDCPQTANPMLLAPKRGPGRSKKASKSLKRD